MNGADGSDDFGEKFQVELVPNTDSSCNGEVVTLCAGGNMATEITIDNDDALYSIQDADTAKETSESDGPITIVVQREGEGTAADSPALLIQAQPRMTALAGYDAAIAGEDYDDLNTPVTMVTIQSGLTTTSFEVNIIDDNMVENAETFSLILGSNFPCAVDKNVRHINIADNDCCYSIDGEDDDNDNIIQQTIGEGDGTVQLAIKCVREDNVPIDHTGFVDVNITQITGKTATSGEDFQNSGSNPVRVHFTSGSYEVTGDTGKVTAVLPITILNDNLVEVSSDEIFNVTLAASNGELCEPKTALITIMDNDALISIQDTAITVSESETVVTFVLIRSGDKSGSDTVRLISEPGTSATGGTSVDNGDYMNVDQEFTFNNGVDTAVISLTIFDDEEIENSESFVVKIVAVRTDDVTVDPNANKLNVTIEDNDCLFSLEVSQDDLVVRENNDGDQASIGVTVRRNGFKDKASSIRLKTGSVGTPILGRDDATPNADFVGIDEELVFQSGDSEKSTTIAILNDNLPELSEVFMLYLEDPQCDIDGASRIIITILDDDEIVIQMANREEMVVEGAGEVVIALTRTGSTEEEDTVSLYVTPSSVDGSQTATAGADYQGGPYTATFRSGSGDTSVSIPIYDDNFQETSPETFVVTIDSVTTPGSAAKVTSNEEDRKTAVFIEDNDDVFNLRDSAISVTESTGTYTTYVDRDGSATTSETVNIYTRDNTASALAGDYNPIQPTALEFPPGTKSMPITFQINNDRDEESAEYFDIILASVDGSIVGQAGATVTILDDDYPMSFKDSADGVYVGEGEGTLTLTVQRTRRDLVPPVEAASVRVMTRTVSSKKRTTDAAAEAGNDYVSINEVLTFNGGVTEVDISISINEDVQSEGEEKFEVYLSDPSPSSTHFLAFPSVLTIVIADNDGDVPGGDGTGGDGDGGTGDDLSQVSIILIGGGVGLAVLLGTLGVIACVALSRMTSSASGAVGQAAAPSPPGYSSAAYYPERGQPVEFGRQMTPSRPRMYYSNQGYRN